MLPGSPQHASPALKNPTRASTRTFTSISTIPRCLYLPRLHMLPNKHAKPFGARRFGQNPKKSEQAAHKTSLRFSQHFYGYYRPRLVREISPRKAAMRNPTRERRERLALVWALIVENLQFYLSLRSQLHIKSRHYPYPSSHPRSAASSTDRVTKVPGELKQSDAHPRSPVRNTYLGRMDEGVREDGAGMDIRSRAFTADFGFSWVSGLSGSHVSTSTDLYLYYPALYPASPVPENHPPAQIRDLANPLLLVPSTRNSAIKLVSAHRTHCSARLAMPTDTRNARTVSQAGTRIAKSAGRARRHRCPLNDLDYYLDAMMLVVELAGSYSTARGVATNYLTSLKKIRLPVYSKYSIIDLTPAQEFEMSFIQKHHQSPPRSHARCGHRMRSSELAPPLVGGVFAGLRRWAAQGRVTHCRKGAARRRGSDGAMTGGHTGVGRGFMLAAVEVEGVDLRRAGRPRPRAPESVLVVVRDGDAARSESVGGLEVGHAWGVDEVESACRRARRVVESLHCRSW
ncbi:hypothetical protein DFP72DRAFT_858615 [Ephemerocybe angulata]|uniref:Uncharacterized protein n=1 Tax=Ephemerocybe angulata TaxID=980116 RepID=A0A8H6LVF7_9AGAR|nr:hypothetical protein DFP72DRAFT_858615 [Tulosesus angulatus]